MMQGVPKQVETTLNNYNSALKMYISVKDKLLDR